MLCLGWQWTERALVEVARGRGLPSQGCRRGTPGPGQSQLAQRPWGRRAPGAGRSGAGAVPEQSVWVRGRGRGRLIDGPWTLATCGHVTSETVSLFTDHCHPRRCQHHRHGPRSRPNPSAPSPGTGWERVGGRWGALRPTEAESLGETSPPDFPASSTTAAASARPPSTESGSWLPWSGARAGVQDPRGPQFFALTGEPGRGRRAEDSRLIGSRWLLP